jgi:aminopeptidase N
MHQMAVTLPMRLCQPLIDPESPVIMTNADAVPEKYRHPLVYFKPAFGLVLLREQILGKDRFDYAFRNYINKWAYKHPQPEDFFRSMESGAGEDLSWFWKGWYL